jgi:hypothetical protein
LASLRKRVGALLAFFMPRINAVRIHVIQNNGLANFPTGRRSEQGSVYARVIARDLDGTHIAHTSPNGFRCKLNKTKIETT